MPEDHSLTECNAETLQQNLFLFTYQNMKYKQREDVSLALCGSFLLHSDLCRVYS
jgi:hypothetical protein